MIKTLFFERIDPMKRFILIMLTAAFILPALFSCAQNASTDTADGSNESAPPEDPTEKATKKPKETKPADFDDQGNIALDGWSDYLIVRGADCSESERTAARQLQTYIKQISGANLDIITDDNEKTEKEIVVGKTNRESEGEFDREELGDEGFIIKTNGKKLFIVGGELRGTLYGVYTYLENYLGCRFYTATFEKIPELDPLPFLDIEEDKQIPIFDTRNPGWSDINDHTISAKLKVNGSHGRGTISSILGGNPTWAGNTCHTLYKLAEMNGNEFNNEPCLSDENVYNTVLKNVRSILAANPNASYISVSQNDSDAADHACKCEKCNAVFEQTGSHAGIYLTFVNRIADAIKEDYPNVMIHTFAYKFTKDIPINVKPADNVMVQFCTIEACFRHSLDSCTNAIDKKTDFKKLLEDWSGICNYLAVWDYTTNFSFYNLSFPNFESIYDNIRLFADHNVKYVYEQGQWQGTSGEFSELRAYLLARLLWDPYMSKEEYYGYMDEFIADYYGEGGVKIKKFIELLLEETADTCTTVYSWPLECYPNTTATVRDSGVLPEGITKENLQNYKKFDWTPYYDWYDEFIPNRILSEGKRLFEEAYALTTDSELKNHIRKSSIQIDVLEIYAYNERISNIENNVYRVAYGLAQKLMDGDEETFTFVANAIKNKASQEAKSALADKNRAYFAKLQEFGINYDREFKPLSSNGRYDFSKLPYYWVN